MSDMEKPLLRELRNHVLWLTINRPDRRNALNADVFAGISQGIDEAISSKEVRAVVLTGAGDKAFCAGADLNPGQSFNYDTSQPNTPLGKIYRKVRQLHVPLIARVNGACMAGGLGLMTMCDMVVASENARFGVPEIKIGLFPAQIMATMQRVIPRRLLVEMCATGEPIDAQRALAAGLVNRVAADLDKETEALLSQITDKSPFVMRRGFYLMKSMEDMCFEDSVAFAESQIPLFAQSNDAKEGRAAFKEKRKPVWTGN